MRIVEEQVPRDPAASLRCFADHRQRLPVAMHQHGEYELTLVAGRGFRRLVGDREQACSGSDLVLLGPHLPHAWRGEDAGGYDCAVVQFGHPFISGALSLPEAAGLRELLQRSSNGLTVPAAALGPLGERLSRVVASAGSTRLVAMLDLLVAFAAAEPVAILDARARPRVDARLARICAWLERHCHHQIDLARLAAQEDSSPAAFGQWFRRHAGCSLSAYLHNLRIGRACGLLLAGERSIAEVAYASGFRNLSNFNRIFKRLRGCSPRTYRQRFAA